MLPENLHTFWLNLSTFAVAFVLSVTIAMAGWFGSLQLGALHHERAVQRVHRGDPPRLGGVGLYLACALAGILFLPSDFQREYWFVILCSAPILILALGEDIGFHTSANARLLVTFLSSGIYIVISGNTVGRTGLPLFDGWLTAYWFAVAFSVLLISSAVQSMNLIDGLNGLCSGIALISTVCLAYIAYDANESILFHASTMFCVAIIGFFVVNFPSGGIFLGDFGAYWLGFLLSTMGIYYLKILPNLAPPSLLLIFFWPAFDLVLTVGRRLTAQRKLFCPDRMHLHHIILRVVRARLGEVRQSQSANSIAAGIILLMAAPPMCLGALFWDEPVAAWFALLACSAVFAGLYMSAVHVAQVGLLRRWMRTRRRSKISMRQQLISPAGRPASVRLPRPATFPEVSEKSD